ncbi:hypothetical protein Ancab_021283 [Ancistrocladus abbreviatus]
MANCDAASKAGDEETKGHKAVFVDTNLDTHLALIVSDVDTVFNLKQKILFEHPRCFPDKGEIEIHALKVKRKGHYYHLSDSMPVRSAFLGSRKNWFLFVEASAKPIHCKSLDHTNDVHLDSPSKMLAIVVHSSFPQVVVNQHRNQRTYSSHQFAEGDVKHLAVGVNHNENDILGCSLSDTNNGMGAKIQEIFDLSGEKNGVVGGQSKCKEESSKIGMSDMQCNMPQEEPLVVLSSGRQKRKGKKRKIEAVSEFANHAAVAYPSTRDIGGYSSFTKLGVGKQLGDGKQPGVDDPRVGISNHQELLSQCNIDDNCTTDAESKKRMNAQIMRKSSVNSMRDDPATHVDLINGINDMLSDNPSKESSRIKNVIKKKGKRKRKSAVAEKVLGENNDLVYASTRDIFERENEVAESFPDTIGRLTSDDADMICRQVNDVEERKVLDIDDASETQELRRYDLLQKTEELGSIVVCGSERFEDRIGDQQSSYPWGEVVQPEPAAMGDCMVEDKIALGEPCVEDKTVGYISDREVIKPEAIIPKNDGKMDVQKNALFSLDGLLTKPSEHARLPRSHKDTQKRKRIKRVSDSDNQMSGEAPLKIIGVQNLKDVEENSCKDIVKDSETPPGAASAQGVGGFQLSAALPRESSGNPSEGVGEGSEVLGRSQGKRTRKRKKRGDDSTPRSHASPLTEGFRNLDKAVQFHESKDLLCEDNDNDQTKPDEMDVTEHRTELWNNDPQLAPEPELLTSDKKEKEEALPSRTSGIMSNGKREKAKISILEEEILGIENITDVASHLLSDGPNKDHNKDSLGIEPGQEQNISLQAEKVGNPDHVGGKSDVMKGKEMEPLQQSQIQKPEENAERASKKQQKKTRKKQTLEANISLQGLGRETDQMSQNEAEALQLTHIEKPEEITENISEKHRRTTRKKQTLVASISPDEIREANYMRQNEIEPLQLTHIEKPEESAEYIIDQHKRKSKKRQTLSGKDHLDSVEEQYISIGGPMSSSEKTREVNACKTTIKTKSVKVSSLHQSTGSKMEAKDDQEMECESSHPRWIHNMIASNNLSNVHEANFEEGSPRAKDANQVGGNKGDSHQMNVKDILHKHQQEIIPAELTVNLAKMKKLDKKLESKEIRKNVDRPSSVDTSSNARNLLKSDQSRGSKRTTQGGISPQRSGMKEKLNKSMVQSSSKDSEVSTAVIEDQSPFADGMRAVSGLKNHSGAKIIKHGNVEGYQVSGASDAEVDSSNRRSHVGGKIKQQLLKLDQSHVSFRKSSSKNLKELVNKSPQKKTLLATSGALFQDASSASSDDESQAAYSDSRTRTPSDNLSSSDDSEGESVGNMVSPRKGSSMEDRKNTISSKSSTQNGLTLESILRSSSRYRKAKLAASQSQLEGTDSQPVDCVPDSQANM